MKTGIKEVARDKKKKKKRATKQRPALMLNKMNPIWNK